MPPRLARICATLLAAIAFASPATAETHALTLWNKSLLALTALDLRGGDVAGFETLKPGQKITVTVARTDGACGGWLMARTRNGVTANALVDICAEGIFVVTSLKRGKGDALSPRLTITELRDPAWF